MIITVHTKSDKQEIDTATLTITQLRQYRLDDLADKRALKAAILAAGSLDEIKTALINYFKE